MKPSIHETEERIAYIKGRIKDMHESIGKAYVEGREDHIPYLQINLNAWQDELRELEEHKAESKPFAVFETKEDYDKHCERIAKGATDDVLQKVVDEVKRCLRYYWETEEILRGESINLANTKVNFALNEYNAVFLSLGVELIWNIDWKDAESRIWKVYGRRLDDCSVTFCMTNFGKDEWWQ